MWRQKTSRKTPYQWILNVKLMIVTVLQCHWIMKGEKNSACKTDPNLNIILAGKISYSVFLEATWLVGQHLATQAQWRGWASSTCTLLTRLTYQDVETFLLVQARAKRERERENKLEITRVSRCECAWSCWRQGGDVSSVTSVGVHWEELWWRS